MSNIEKKIVHMSEINEMKALERLNRLTGLDFESMPISLVNGAANSGNENSSDTGDSVRDTSSLVYRLNV